MGIHSLKALARRQPIRERLSIPVAQTQLDRYYRLKHEMEKRELKKLHDLAREKLDELMDEVESLLAKE